MNWINEYLTPGTYTENDTNHIVVVCDVVNHVWNVDKQLQEFTETPLVIFRNLIDVEKQHKRYSMPLDLFKTKFTAV